MTTVLTNQSKRTAGSDFSQDKRGKDKEANCLIKIYDIKIKFKKKKQRSSQEQDVVNVGGPESPEQRGFWRLCLPAPAAHKVTQTYLTSDLPRAPSKHQTSEEAERGVAWRGSAGVAMTTKKSPKQSVQIYKINRTKTRFKTSDSHCGSAHSQSTTSNVCQLRLSAIHSQALSKPWPRGLGRTAG